MLETIGGIDFSLLFNVLGNTVSQNVSEFCAMGEFTTIVKLVNVVLNVIRIAIPIILILYGTIDLAKAVMAGKDDEIKGAQKLLIKRVIYAVVVFLLVTIIKLVFKLVSGLFPGDSALSCFETLGF